jgi:tetratricopeptide (TPR) repeat protein
MRAQLLLTSLFIAILVVFSVGFQCGTTEMTSARLYITKSDWDNAIRNLEAELAKNATNEEAWYLLGEVRAKKNDLAGMVEAFDHAMNVGQTHKKDIEGLKYNYWVKCMNVGAESFNRREMDFRIGMTKDEAIQGLGKPDSVIETMTDFGATEQWVYSKLDLYVYFDKSVLKGWQEFNKSVSTMGEANFLLERAITAFHSAVLLEPDSAAGYKYVGLSYLAKNEISRGRPALEQSYTLSDDPTVAQTIGRIETNVGLAHKAKYEGPENKTEIRIWMTPDEVKDKLGEPTSKSTTKEKKVAKEKWVYTDRKLTLNFEGGELRSWEEDGKKEQKEPWVDHKDSAERDSAMKHFETAITYLDKAIKTVQQRLNSRPEKELKVGMSEQLLAELIGNLSDAYIAADKGETALDLFKSGVEADPKNKFFHYNYGVLLLNLTGSDSVKADTTGAMANILYEKAIEQFKAAVSIDSTYESALYNLGAGYVNWGVHIRDSSHNPAKVEAAYMEKFKLALPNLEQMTRLKTDNADAWELVGKVYANLGMSKEATAAFEKADQLRKR